VLYRAHEPTLVHMASNYDTQLHNLERALAMALGAAQQAEGDLNSIRLKAGLPPIKYFHLSAAVAEETKVGPKGGGVTPNAAAMMMDAGRVRRGEVVSMEEAARLRLEEDKRR
jgi:hypothetical protein